MLKPKHKASELIVPGLTFLYTSNVSNFYFVMSLEDS